MPLLLVVLTIVSVGFALWPVLTRQNLAYSTSPSDTPLGRLALRKEILLSNIADLDFEFAMGKLAQDDYESLRETLKRQAALVIEQMDVLQRRPAAAGAGAAESPSGKPPAADARFCADCGSGLPGGARFCPTCGSKVRVA